MYKIRNNFFVSDFIINESNNISKELDYKNNLFKEFNI